LYSQETFGLGPFGMENVGLKLHVNYNPIGIYNALSFLIERLDTTQEKYRNLKREKELKKSFQEV
jgi:hypothetical protein